MNPPNRDKLRFASGDTTCAAWHYPGTSRACIVMAGGTGVTLVRADGTSALTYGGLIAYDATGRAIPASMSVATTADGQSLSIRVDDAGAQYPLTIDPFVQQAKLTGDAMDVSLFGNAVAINGDGTEVAIGSKGVNIGFNNGQGVVYVFKDGKVTKHS